MSKSIKIHSRDFDEEDDEEESPTERKKREKLQNRRLAKFEKVWHQEDIIDS